jgi:hypothetical protein
VFVIYHVSYFTCHSKWCHCSWISKCNKSKIILLLQVYSVLSLPQDGQLCVNGSKITLFRLVTSEKSRLFAYSWSYPHIRFLTHFVVTSGMSFSNSTSKYIFFHCNYSFSWQPMHRDCQKLDSHIIILLKLHALILKFSEKIAVFNNNNNNISALFVILRSVESKRVRVSYTGTLWRKL